MVVRTPPVDKGLKRLGSPATAPRRLPVWGWHSIMEQLAHRPHMVSDACGHRGRLPAAIVCGEARMYGTEVVDRPHQIHAAHHRTHSPGRAAGAPAQGRQAAAKGAIEALDIRRVQHLTAP